MRGEEEHGESEKHTIDYCVTCSQPTLNSRDQKKRIPSSICATASKATKETIKLDGT
jgi:hypothetical protein